MQEDGELGLVSVRDSSSLPLLPPQVAFSRFSLTGDRPQAAFLASPPEHTRRLHNGVARESSACLVNKDLISASTLKTQWELKNEYVHISFPSGFCGAVCKRFGKVGFPSGKQISG